MAKKTVKKTTEPAGEAIKFVKKEAADKKNDSKNQSTPALDSTKSPVTEKRAPEDSLRSQIMTVKRSRGESRKFSNEFFELFDLTTVGRFILSPRGLIKEANLTGMQMLSSKGQNIIGQRFGNFICSDYLDKYYVFRRTLLGKTSPMSCELKLQGGDGSKFYVNMVGSCVYDTPDQMKWLQIAVFEIADREKYETMLQESEERFRLAMEVTNDGLWDWDIATNKVYRNPRFAQMLGYEPHEIGDLHEEWRDLVHPDDRQSVFEISREILTGRIDFFNYEYRLMTKSGDYKWILSRGKLVTRDDDDEPLRVIGTNIDIDVQKKAKRDEIENLSKFPAENPNPVIRIAKDGTIFFANDASSKVLETWGCKRGERVPNEFAQRIEETMSLSEVSEIDFDCHDGTVFLLTLAPIADKGYVNAYGINITERLRAELQARESHEQLRSLSSKLSLAEEHERKRISEDIHDGIIQQLVFLDIKVKSLDKIAKDAKLTEAYGEMRKLLGGLIENARKFIFDLSEPVLYELGLAHAIEEYLRTEIEEKLNIKTDFKYNLQTKSLDQDIIIFLYKSAKELLVNVLKHAEADRIGVYLTQENSHLKICVEDNGCGFKTNTDVKGKLAGGFGLFNIREKVGYLGGDLNIESRAGVGSQVTLTVPIKEQD